MHSSDGTECTATRRSTRSRKTPEKLRSSLLLDDEEEIGMDERMGLDRIRKEREGILK